MKRLAYATAAVAAVAVSVAALSAFGPRFGIGSQPSPTATIQQTPNASASPVAGCTGMSASGDVLTVGWCPTRPDGQQMLIAFRLTVHTTLDPSQQPDTTTAFAWLNGEQLASDEVLFFRPFGHGVQPGGRVAISVDGPATLEAWLAKINGEAAYTVSEPLPIALGAAEGYVFDVSPGPGQIAADEPPLIDNGAISWKLGDSTSRVWLVNHAGQPVMFVTSPVGGDQPWARWVGDILETIEWD